MVSTTNLNTPNTPEEVNLAIFCEDGHLGCSHTTSASADSLAAPMDRPTGTMPSKASDRKHQSVSEAMRTAPDEALRHEAQAQDLRVQTIVGGATPAAPLDRKALICLLVQHFSRWNLTSTY